MSKIYKNDTATDIYLDFREDISTGANPNIYIQRPDLTTGTWSAAITGTTQLKHTLTSAEISAAGDYYVQGYVELGSWKGRSETVIIHVYELYQ